MINVFCLINKMNLCSKLVLKKIKFSFMLLNYMYNNYIEDII